MKTVVIGAGIGGLTTACLLASKGHQVTLLEKNATPGGKMNERVLDGYRFDTGPSLLTMPFVLEEIFAECGKNLGDYVELIPISPLCRYNWMDGTRMDCFPNLPETLREIQRIAPDDCEAYVRFLGYSADIYKKTSDTFLFNPLNRLSDLKSLKKSDFFKIDAFPTVSTRVDKFFKSEYLRQVFKRFTTYNGSSPFIAPATLNVIAYVELCLGGYYVKGGMYRIARALEQMAVGSGVEIRYGATVSSIKASNEKAQSILLESGEEISTSAVFSNADSTYTYTELLDDKSVPKRHRQRFLNIEPSCSGFVMLLGTDRKFGQLTHHNIFFSNDYDREFREIFMRKSLPQDPTIYIANTSEADPDHAPPGGSNLFVLVNAPYLTDTVEWAPELTEEYGDLIIKKLEKCGLDGLRDSIKVREHITPQDFYELYLTNKGSIYGTSSNHTLSAFMRPRNKSPFLNNLYLMGGSTHPGGGIPLVMLSAKNAVSLFLRDVGE